MFVTFQTEFNRPADPNWRSIYFDLSAPGNVQQSQFVALEASEVDARVHFPLDSLFDSVAFRLASSGFNNEKQIRAIDGLHSIFKEAQIPIQMIETEDRTTVAIVFERINRMGVELTTLELLSAWTWSEDFNLRTKLEHLEEELEEFSFGGIGADPNLVLRCCAAILKGDPSIDALVNMDGSSVRADFQRVENGIKGAIDFLRNQLKVATIRTLPYPLMLAPLAVFFAVPGTTMRMITEEEASVLKKWFWRSCFSERYSGQTVRAARTDVQEMANLRDGKSHALGAFNLPARLTSFFLSTDFRINSARTATFVTMLAQLNPRSFISGNFVNLEKVLQSYNKAEFHHIYPKSYIDKLEKPPRMAGHVNSLVNFCFLSRADNNKIRAHAPSVYRAMMPSDPTTVNDILSSACLPAEMFNDDFSQFLSKRLVMLSKLASELCGLGEREAASWTATLRTEGSAAQRLYAPHPTQQALPGLRPPSQTPGQDALFDFGDGS